MSDLDMGVGRDLDDADVISGKNNRIRRGGPGQNVTITQGQDILSALYDVERELQSLHREVSKVQQQLQNTVFSGLLVLLVIVGLAIFFGDRQITILAGRIHDLETQMQRIERQLSRQNSLPQ